MLRPPNELPAVYVCTEPVDFRKGIVGLAALVEEMLGVDPFGEHLFAFTNRRRDRCRLLVWERNGFVLWQKRLEKERFHWPRVPPDAEREVVTLSGQELNWLLDGFDLRHWRPHRRLQFASVG